MSILKNNKGAMLVTALAATTIFLTLVIGLISLGLYRQKLYLQQSAKHQALHIAEAGVNYYRWHLAHEAEDYADGTGDVCVYPNSCGPYEHTFTTHSGDIAGAYTLEITPPPIGSTIVKIKSIGWLNDYPNIKRTIEVRYGDPSLAHYSFLTNSDIWFGAGESVKGEMHSNGGVRMDGTNDSLVASARDTYICTSDHDCDSGNCSAPCTWIVGTGCECPGVWGVGSGSALWNYPVTTVDFGTITMDIAQMKADAQEADGFYLGSSGGSNEGYHVIFQSGGTFDVWEVNDLGAALEQYKDTFDGWTWLSENINSETLLSENNPMPNNGIIYLEDDVWVEGTVNGRATLIAARLPDNVNKRKSIYIPNNINYLARDGNHSLGLIGQKHVKVLGDAPTDLIIDAILLAQNGRCFRTAYWPQKTKNSIEVYGSIITNQIWTWSFVGGYGYTNTTSIYDSYVTYAPPPSFPTTGEYAFISWEEK